MTPDELMDNLDLPSELPAETPPPDPPEPLPDTPTTEPVAELRPSPQGLLEAQRDTLVAQLTTYPPLHAEHKRIRSASAELEAAIRERDRLSAP
jgi:hypothetical protein